MSQNYTPLAEKSPLDRDKLVLVLRMLSSAHDGERASAALLASRMVEGCGKDWSDLLADPDADETPEPQDSALEELSRRVEACLSHPDMRGDQWRASFLTSMLGQLARGRMPTAKQSEKLAELFGKAGC